MAPPSPAAGTHRILFLCCSLSTFSDSYLLSLKSKSLHLIFFMYIQVGKS
ncbi:hypothetical protein HanXRQr2_Chr15g0678411 [Helianthus annuus]|uniref:Uncharacterized protein n=1 Tax=Helianthus annuus TaxID=4232 RepID=A0A9K3DYC7_HELAN|nr:hypothetical protein HanXRQr2_Chr15g0678411 [Helianthus annuus]